MERSRFLLAKKRDLLMSLSSGFITQNGQMQTTCTAPMQLSSTGPCISLEKTLYYILLTLGSICQNLVALSTFGKFQTWAHFLSRNRWKRWPLTLNAVIIEESSLPQGNQTIPCLSCIHPIWETASLTKYIFNSN